LQHKFCLTISASSCAISMYVVLFFAAQVLPHDFGLFVCHQSVRGLVLCSTSSASRFRPLRVPSGSTWSRSLKHKFCLTISASSCAIRKYVVPFFEAQASAYNCAYLHPIHIANKSGKYSGLLCSIYYWRIVAATDCGLSLCSLHLCGGQWWTHLLFIAGTFPCPVSHISDHGILWYIFIFDP